MLYKIVSFITCLLSDSFEKKLVKKIKSTNINPKFIIDAGAHIGEYSEIFLKNFSSIKKIYCYEPQINIFKILKRNFSKTKKIQFNNIALGEKNKIEYFNIGYHQRSSSFLNYNSSNLFYKIKSVILFGKVSNIVKYRSAVRVKSIDNIFKKKTTIDILKIDVEGYELNVLKGSLNLIKNNKIKLIIIEITTHKMFKGYSSKKIEKFLKENNFNLFSTHKFPFYPFEDRIYVHKSVAIKK
jgi:FkbM family methyltransferase